MDTTKTLALILDAELLYEETTRTEYQLAALQVLATLHLAMYTHEVQQQLWSSMRNNA